MRKTQIVAIIALLTIPAFADAPKIPDAKQDPRGGFLTNLTQEQRECVESKNCILPAAGERPNEEARDCLMAAIEVCGIEMPEPPARPDGTHPHGEHKEHGQHDGKPHKGTAPTERVEVR